MPDTPKHGLSLSGGGFRATLFHLGVVKLLRDAGVLHQIHRIGAVSGGSILAAHLVLNWDRYTGDDAAFVSAAREVIEFCRSDVRGNVARSWILAWLLVIPRLLKRKHWTFTNLLQNQYARLFKNATLADLHFNATVDRPQVVLYCTSLSTGTSCAFGRSGFWWNDKQDVEQNIVAPHLPVSFAVAASSAFPPLFPPIAITNEELFCGINEFAYPHYLTDGGVYDNLGINRLMWHQGQVKDLDDFIVSDAESEFDWEFHNNYKMITSRNIRASDVLMKRVSTLQYELLARQEAQLVRINIASTLYRQGDKTVLSPEAQRSVRNIRTDLDAFSDIEISCLLQHGYSTAREALIQRKLVPADAPGYAAGLLWPTAPDTAALPQALRFSRHRRMGLWSATDGKSWASLFLICLALALPAAPWYLRVHRLERKATAEMDISRVLAETYSTQDKSFPSDPEALRKKVESNLTAETAAEVPRIYVKLASERQRPRMQAAIVPLQEKGFLVLEIADAGARSPARSQIRYFRASDKAVAESAARALAETAQLPAEVAKFPAPHNSQAQHLELWCAPSW